MADSTIKYIGTEGAHYSGIPARDLSQADYDALDTDQRAIVRASTAYDYAGFKAAGDKAKAKDAAPSEAAPAKDASKG
jgi:hypothetical protein